LAALFREVEEGRRSKIKDVKVKIL